MATPDVSDWTGADLATALALDEDDDEAELEATLWGVGVTFTAMVTDLSADLGPEYARFVGYYVDAWPDGGELHGTPMATPEDCLDEARRLLRDYAPPSVRDAWLAAEAIRSGLQPALFEVPS